MNPITILIRDLELIRRHLHEAADEPNAVAAAYLLANREAIGHYVTKLYEDHSTRRRDRVAAEYPTIDYSVVQPAFEKLAMQSLVLAAQGAWLGISPLDEDSINMTIRALRAAEILVPPITPCVVFLSPVEKFLEVNAAAAGDTTS